MVVRRLPALPLVAVLLCLLAGCGVGIPSDPDQSLERIRSTGQLRVGVSPHPPFTDFPDGLDAPPTGTEVDLVTGFAEQQGARPVWTPGGEEHLVELMKDQQLDIIIGGLTSQTPYSTDVGVTRSYLTREEPTSDGGTGKRSYVMAVTMGENALLTELEHYLDEVQP
ncbi:ABC transporter substrate-binding protein [Desertihabitans brevis]|uniref:ABC transporter substrate-binding protein n=1 Tax=Desertihabitans brevis TaxID=2268447 RepID=A0A367Z260_9ACTN|nr:transporter substrate-binding domain-containing protein [Desertihabitans brevis]RCK71311.1 ABC transporter substrate-binding protein [Desertihabitans brevis]